MTVPCYKGWWYVSFSPYLYASLIVTCLAPTTIVSLLIYLLLFLFFSSFKTQPPLFRPLLLVSSLAASPSLILYCFFFLLFSFSYLLPLHIFSLVLLSSFSSSLLFLSPLLGTLVCIHIPCSDLLAWITSILVRLWTGIDLVSEMAKLGIQHKIYGNSRVHVKLIFIFGL